jgi:hypothetical protein
MLARLGIGTPHANSDRGFQWEAGYVENLARRGRRVNPWTELPTGHVLLTFWYRTSPQPMTPSQGTGVLGGSARVSPTSPPVDVPGMTSVLLDMRGRLLRLEVVLAQVEQAPGAPVLPVDWRAVLAETGVDPSAAAATTPAWLPLAWADTRAAWSASYPDLPGVPVRIEAAAYRGRPVYVRVIRAWTPPDRAVPAERGAAQKTSEMIAMVLLTAVLVFGGFIAHRNLALNRADRHGAARTAIATGAMFLGAGLFEPSHTLGAAEVALFGELMGSALFVAAQMWVLYLALEPSVRRRWPTAMITWSRLLTGRLRDPMIGRDVLVGAAVAVALSLAGFMIPLTGMSSSLSASALPRLSPLLGTRFVLNSLLTIGVGALLNILLAFGVLFVFRVVLRRDWLMAAAFIALTVVQALLRGTPLVGVAATAVGAMAMIAVLLRLGFFGFCVAAVVNSLLTIYPLSTDVGAWYGAPTVFAVIVLAVAAFGAFWIALGGKPLLGQSLDG